MAKLEELDELQRKQKDFRAMHMQVVKWELIASRLSAEKPWNPLTRLINRIEVSILLRCAEEVRKIMKMPDSVVITDRNFGNELKERLDAAKARKRS